MRVPRGHRTLSPDMERLLADPTKWNRLLTIMTGTTGRRWRELKHRIRKAREGA